MWSARPKTFTVQSSTERQDNLLTCNDLTVSSKVSCKANFYCNHFTAQETEVCRENNLGQEIQLMFFFGIQFRTHLSCLESMFMLSV